MNKKKLRALVTLSVNSVVLMVNQLDADVTANQQTPTATDTSQQAMTAPEQAFTNKLSQNAAEMFKNMTTQQRVTCMQMASHDCQGKNACKGQGACKTADHTCAGMNACKGQGACKMDPNKAVKIMTDQMAQKRLVLA